MERLRHLRHELLAIHNPRAKKRPLCAQPTPERHTFLVQPAGDRDALSRSASGQGCLGG
jgi:hypothetical protein